MMFNICTVFEACLTTMVVSQSSLLIKISVTTRREHHFCSSS